MTKGGEFLVKQGDLSGGWIDEYGPNFGLDKVASAYVSGDLIGVVTEGGEFLVKQGNLSGRGSTNTGPTSASRR